MQLNLLFFKEIRRRLIRSIIKMDMFIMTSLFHMKQITKNCKKYTITLRD